MDSIRLMISFAIKAAVGLLCLGGIWWLVSRLYPQLQVQSLFSTEVSDEGWLPSPKKYASLLATPKTPSANDHVFITPEAYNGYGTAYTANSNYGSSQAYYVSYTSTGVQVTPPSGQVKTTDTSNSSLSPGAVAYMKKEDYIRNLSIYNGFHIINGASFVGDARSTMFINGKFPIIIADTTGRAVTIAFAEATSNWTAPGWVHFTAKVTAYLPNTAKCVMVFEQAQERYTPNNPPLRVAMPIWCN